MWKELPSPATQIGQEFGEGGGKIPCEKHLKAVWPSHCGGGADVSLYNQ